MRGWVVKYKNGKVLTEWGFGQPFSHLPNPGDIEAVAIVYDKRHWVIPNKQHYFSQKQVSVLLGLGGPQHQQGMGQARIETRTIGYWEDGQQIKFTLNEATGEMRGPYVDEG
jgi:hypothetical protein